MVDARASAALWQSVHSLPQFRRLLELRLVSQFGDGLFQAGLAGALLFNPDRAADPWAIAGAFAVLFLPYSLLGPFAGALLDRWDRRWVLVGASLGKLVLVLGVSALLAVGASDLAVLCGALIVNGFSRFVLSGLSAALPHVVPREQVVTMNSVAVAGGAAAAVIGANFMLLPRVLFGADDAGSAAIILLVVLPVTLALVFALRFPPRVLGPDDTGHAIHGSVFYTVSTGWVHGVRAVFALPTVAGTLAGLAAHRMVLGINTLLVLVIVRHTDTPTVAVTGLGSTALFVGAIWAGAFLAIAVTPAAMRRFDRYATVNAALAIAAVVQLGAAGLHLPVMVLCGFLVGAAGQVVKLCVDSAMQLDVDDARRGHAFAVQDSLFWLAFVAAVAASAAVVPATGHAPSLVVAGAVIYLAGLAVHAVVARRAPAPD